MGPVLTFTFPSKGQVPIHVGAAGWDGAMSVKFLAQGNAITRVTSHSPITKLQGSTGAMWVKFLVQGNNNNNNKQHQPRIESGSQVDPKPLLLLSHYHALADKM